MAYTYLTRLLKNRNLERISKHLGLRILCPCISYDRRCVLFENAKGKPQRHAPGGHPAPAPSASSSDVTIRKEPSLTAKTIERNLPALLDVGNHGKGIHISFSVISNHCVLWRKSQGQNLAQSPNIVVGFGVSRATWGTGPVHRRAPATESGSCKLHELFLFGLAF